MYDQELSLSFVKNYIIMTTEITLNILCVYIIEALYESCRFACFQSDLKV